MSDVAKTNTSAPDEAAGGLIADSGAECDSRQGRHSSNTASGRDEAAGKYGDKYCLKRDEGWWCRTADFKAGWDAGRTRTWLELNEHYNQELKKQDEEIAQLRAQLAHRHIIGKAYDVSRESINRLAGELDESREEVAFANALLQSQASDFSKSVVELTVKSDRLAEELDERLKQIADLKHELEARMKHTAALELIAGGSEFQCEVGERNCIAAARLALKATR